MRNMRLHTNPQLDIILETLNALAEARPGSSFTQSLLQQYLERGSLSKKQLQGLHSKASKAAEIPTAWVASLEAIIIKMPDRFKSELPAAKPMYEKDETSGKLIAGILEKYPQHKRVLFLKAKYDNNETLSPADIAELKKFSKALLKTE